MTDELLRLCKAHCRIDHDDDDSYVMYLYRTAVSYLSGAGIAQSDDGRYLFAAFSIVLEWYDGIPVGTVTVGTQKLINQLKHTSDMLF